MRILITGVTGFVGQTTAKLALSMGHDVFGVSRTPLPKLLLDQGVVEFKIDGWPSQSMHAEIGNQMRAADWFDCVIHLAGDARYGNKHSYTESNVTPTRVLVETLSSYSPHTKFVFASSVGAQDYRRMSRIEVRNEETTANPLSRYGESKFQAEMYVQSSSLPFAIARLGMVIGPGMREDSHLNVLIKEIKHPLKRQILSHLGGSLPLVDVMDASKALLHLASTEIPNGTYLVVGENLTIAEATNTIRNRKHRGPMLNLGRSASLFPARVAATLAPLLSYSNQKLQDTGWKLETPIKESIAKVVQSTQSHDTYAVVTGVGSGLGRALLEELTLQNRLVIGIDIDSDAISKLQLQFPQHLFECSDVCDSQLFVKLQTSAEATNRRISSLFLVAGIGRKTSFVDQDKSNIKSQFDVNVMARMSLSHDFLQYLKDSAGPSELVIISSSSALQPLPTFATYCATNAALLSFGRALAMETDPAHCHVLTVVPSGMDTNFQSKAGVKRLKNEKLLSPSEVARKIVDTSSKHSGVLIIGRNAKITVISSRILPHSVADKIWKKLTGVAR
jgi:nucleoside-diphosphate-sugar epimerase